MEIRTKATNLTLSDFHSEYLEKRLDAVSKFANPEVATIIDAEIAKQTHHEKGDVFYAEATVSLDGKVYRATAEAETIEAAIDEMKDNLVRELRRDKRKMIHNLREGGAQVKNWVRGFWG